MKTYYYPIRETRIAMDDYLASTDEQKIKLSVSLDGVFSDRLYAVAYELGIALEEQGFCQTKEVSGLQVPQYGDTKLLHNLTWEQSIFGVKDVLQPIEEYIGTIKQSADYREYVESTNTFVLDTSNSSEMEVYAKLTGIDSTVIISLSNIDGRHFAVLAVLKPTFIMGGDEVEHIAFQRAYELPEDTEPFIHASVGDEYLFVELTKDSNLHFQLKHRLGEGLVMDVVKDDEVIESFGFLFYDDMDDIEDYDELLDDALAKFHYKSQLDDFVFAKAIKEIERAFTVLTIGANDAKKEEIKNNILNSLATGGKNAEEAFFSISSFFARLDMGKYKENLLNMDLSKEKALEIRELLNLEPEVVKSHRLKLLGEILTLVRGRQENIHSVSLVAHNTILGLRDWNNKVSFIIDQKSDRGVINLFNVDGNLSVERYTPEVAKKWLEEPLRLSVGDDELTSKMSKVLISEPELRQIVMADKMNALVFAEKNIVLSSVNSSILDGEDGLPELVADAKARIQKKKGVNRHFGDGGNIPKL